jgi:3D (Asp-Asp-Asp) domain-containing protein
MLLTSSCETPPEKQVEDYLWYDIEVTATAYNSVANQTDDTPFITAFGDSLSPGKRYIAVSRDLLKMGMVENTPVKIEGFDSIYLVKDKMNKRWTNRIDIYMGNDVKKARQWGKKKICITYGEKIKKPDSQ